MILLICVALSKIWFLYVYQEAAGNSTVAGKVHSSSSSTSTGSNEAIISGHSHSRENLCNSSGNGPSLTVLPVSRNSSETEQHGREM